LVSFAALGIVLVAGLPPLDIGISTGPVFPVGNWGETIGTGIEARASVHWKPWARVGVGAALQADLFGDAWDGDASLSCIGPEISTALFLRPGARVFNPGIEAAFGLTRSQLQSGGGTDPASWDPSWRAGLRWDFSLGMGFRGAAGFDFRGILASGESADSFGLVFRVSREVGR
jgi:hypothetical protein